MSLSGLSPVGQFIYAQKNELSSAQTYFKENRTLQRNVDTFQKNAPNITTTKQLMGDYASNQVVLGAYNLSSMANQTALERDLLSQDPADKTSVAGKSGNASWLSFADAFSTLGKGKGTAAATPFTNESIDLTTKAYQLQQYETSDSLQKNGVGDALYFSRKMQGGKIKTVDQLMSDKTLLKVAEVVSGYEPDQFGALDFSQQKRIITNKVDLSKLQTPDQINRYAQRYLAQLQIHPEYNKQDKPATMMDLFGGSDDGGSVLSLFGDTSGNNDYGSQLASLF